MNRIIAGLLSLVFCCAAFAEKKTVEINPTGFKKIDKGTVVFYHINKKNFGKIPEVIKFKYPFDFPHKKFWFADAYFINKPWDFEDAEAADAGTEGIVYHNYENKEVELWLYISGEVKDWDKLKLTVTGHYLSAETKKNNMFMDKVGDIKGIVGTSRDEHGVYSIRIADCMPNIREVLTEAREMAKKYDFKINEVSLVSGHEYLIEDEE